MATASAAAAVVLVHREKDVMREFKNFEDARTCKALVKLLTLLVQTFPAAVAAEQSRCREREAQTEEAKAEVLWRRLQSLWQSSAARVALEFGFPDKNVALVLVQLIVSGEKLKDAAHLLDLLEDLEATEEDLQIPCGLAEVLNMEDPFPKLSREAASASASAPTRHMAAASVNHPTPVKVQEGNRDNPRTTYHQVPEEVPPTRDELVKETSLLMWKKKCGQCHKEDSNRLIVDCGHVALCSSCEKVTDLCPQCGTKKTFVVQVFLG